MVDFCILLLCLVRRVADVSRSYGYMGFKTRPRALVAFCVLAVVALHTTVLCVSSSSMLSKSNGFELPLLLFLLFRGIVPFEPVH